MILIIIRETFGSVLFFFLFQDSDSDFEYDTLNSVRTLKTRSRQQEERSRSCQHTTKGKRISNILLVAVVEDKAT